MNVIVLPMKASVCANDTSVTTAVVPVSESLVSELRRLAKQVQKIGLYCIEGSVQASNPNQHVLAWTKSEFTDLPDEPTVDDIYAAANDDPLDVGNPKVAVFNDSFTVRTGGDDSSDQVLESVSVPLSLLEEEDTGKVIML